MVSWLPMFHDMGMVGFLTVPMSLGIELVKITPADFLGRPAAVAGADQQVPRHRHRRARTSPTRCVGRRLARVDEPDAYDLSTLRSRSTAPSRSTRLRSGRSSTPVPGSGCRPSACWPAYGMAEATLAVSFAPLFTACRWT